MPLLAAAPLIGAAVGAAGGIGKTISEGEKANRDRQLASATQRYSPWTGLKANAPEDPNAFGNIASGVAGGAGMGQNIAAAVPGAPAAEAPGADASTGAPGASLMPQLYGKNPFGLGGK